MLTLQKEQLDVFVRSTRERFEKQVRAILWESWPAACQAIGMDAVEKFVREKIDEAVSYELDRECDVAHYVNVMYALAHDFQTDAQETWVQEILTDRTLSSAEKVEELYEGLDTLYLPAEHNDDGRWEEGHV